MTSKMVFIFISPHLDDVVLSCGGYVHQLTARGNKVIIATVVTADDTSQLPPSWLAQRNLRAWGGKEHIFAIRCKEDKAAATVLGAEISHLGFLDCIFRRDSNQDPLYTQRVVNVPVHPWDWQYFLPALQKTMKDLFNQYSEHSVRIMCPLAIGGHVDHVIVRHAVEAVSDPRCRIYYEEFPYARQIDTSREKLERLIPNTILLSDQDKKSRLDAAAFYTTQIPGLFPSWLDILLEIARTRIPYLRRLISIRHNIPAAIRRMTQALSSCYSIVGGERYWTYADQAGLPE